MKKMKLLFLFTFLTYGSIYAQWEKKHYVDDFGDKTDKTYESFMVTGTFTNSVSTDRDAVFEFIKKENAFRVKVYEFGYNLATSLEHRTVTVKIKQPNCNVVTINDVSFTKKGSLYFDEENFTEIMSAFSSSGQYTMLFNRTSDQSTSRYRLNFKLEELNPQEKAISSF
ncbi:hypothetical protein LB456_08125 [Psychroflexus sp. CAK57W]|uniref:hypothetical protein n=1 Tax=Psychroflexus curvus TaxID=2873595 RepID=UPI001CCB574C|nr:hypothetical protein [Psychroflexus curvus]MBZ9629067.1 hypothetical protein [Psychroflexus curvus]MBZ9787421.1 hypothetical protein [Psychroflexus curvus]